MWGLALRVFACLFLLRRRPFLFGQLFLQVLSVLLRHRLHRLSTLRIIGKFVVKFFRAKAFDFLAFGFEHASHVDGCLVNLGVVLRKPHILLNHGSQVLEHLGTGEVVALFHFFVDEGQVDVVGHNFGVVGVGLGRRVAEILRAGLVFKNFDQLFAFGLGFFPNSSGFGST